MRARKDGQLVIEKNLRAAEGLYYYFWHQNNEKKYVSIISFISLTCGVIEENQWVWAL
jgi:hypothetical protein